MGRTSTRRPTAKSFVYAGVIAALIGVALTATNAVAATVNVVIHAQPIKPLTLTKVQDLDLGTVTLAPGSWSNGVVSISQSGVLSCTNANVICTGATKAAQYNVQGSSQQSVYISAPNVTLTKEGDPTQTLTLITDAPASIMLKNSGQKGTDFSIGGSITLKAATPAGTYLGTFNVTVNY